jgi:hypothetical protein
MVWILVLRASVQLRRGLLCVSSLESERTKLMIVSILIVMTYFLYGILKELCAINEREDYKKAQLDLYDERTVIKD